ncbi:MAG: molybdopterin-guanine dinucleotide biosynthesis protein B [candidate division Zixibacteria bacterium]|nr:molybdopterin-guanine dinucleotide biosynthesis protein B [candidate division Zixibacteria bacterium]
MLELCIVGAKNSGKTTLIEELVHRLSTNGYKVATIKHTAHSHAFDTPGKDSFRHRAAGAKATIVKSNQEFAFFASPETEINNGIEILFHKYFDVCLIEGDVYSDKRKIVISRNYENLKVQPPKNVIAIYGPECALNKTIRFELNDVEGLYALIVKLMNEGKKEIHHEG